MNLAMQLVRQRTLLQEANCRRRARPVDGDRELAAVRHTRRYFAILNRTEYSWRTRDPQVAQIGSGTAEHDLSGFQADEPDASGDLILQRAEVFANDEIDPQSAADKIIREVELHTLRPLRCRAFREKQRDIGRPSVGAEFRYQECRVDRSSQVFRRSRENELSRPQNTYITIANRGTVQPEKRDQDNVGAEREANDEQSAEQGQLILVTAVEDASCTS